MNDQTFQQLNEEQQNQNEIYQYSSNSINNSKIKNKKQEDLMLIDLGLKGNQIVTFQKLISQQAGINLQKEVALFLIIIHDCQHEQQVLQFLATDESGFYPHFYLPINQINNKCLICDHLQEEHVYNSEEDIQYAKEIMDKVKLHLFTNPQLNHRLSQIVEYQTCQICVQDVDKNLFLVINQINHEVCNDCFKQYLNDKILQNKINDIQCPHCNMIMEKQIILQNVDSNTFQKYLRFLRDYQIRLDPQNRWCPNIQCSVLIRLPTEKIKTINCPTCKTLICAECGLEEHGQIPCQQLAEEQIRQLTEKKDIQRCQNCKALVEKMEGCNHITCAICKYQWCWLCGDTYDKAHYVIFNPFGCPALQSGQFNIKNMGPIKRFFVKIAVTILFFLVLPLALVFGGPVFCTIQYYEHFGRRISNKFIGICISGFLFILAFAVDPLIWFLFALCFIPGIIIIAYTSYRDRSNIIQRAQENLKERELIQLDISQAQQILI